MTWILILFFSSGGQTYSSVAIGGFASHEACDAYAARVQREVKPRQPTFWDGAVRVRDWHCTGAP